MQSRSEGLGPCHRKNDQAATRPGKHLSCFLSATGSLLPALNCATFEPKRRLRTLSAGTVKNTIRKFCGCVPEIPRQGPFPPLISVGHCSLMTRCITPYTRLVSARCSVSASCVDSVAIYKLFRETDSLLAALEKRVKKGRGLDEAARRVPVFALVGPAQAAEGQRRASRDEDQPEPAGKARQQTTRDDPRTVQAPATRAQAPEPSA